jgi:hypothetical protein
MRPLGIPTMKDRTQQALHLLALDPVVETTADQNSYGFRQQRSCADAIEECFKTLARPNPQWILEGDIKSCFDRISHDWILAHVPMDRVINSPPLKLIKLPLWPRTQWHCDPPAPQFGAEESSNIALWSREESRQVNCFAVAKPGNAGGRVGVWSGLGASRIRDFYSLFGRFPKLDRIAIWIFKPRKGPH